MSVIATAVKHLLAAGVTGDALVAAIADLEAELSAAAPVAVDSAAERRREKDREYQAARRAERRQMSADSADYHDSADSVDGASLSLPPNEIKSNPPPKPTCEKTPGASDPAELDVLARAAADLPKSAKGKRAAAEAVPIPAGWEPILTPAAQRIVDGWPPGMLDRERMAFEAHAASTDRVTKDWQAAFRTWIAKAEQFRTERNGDRSAGTGRGFAGSHQPDRRDGFTRSLDDTIARGRGAAPPLQ